MMTIALVGQKGGAGKSTAVMTLGNAALARGKRVVMIETDKQGTTFEFVQSAYERYPEHNIENILRVIELKTDDAEKIDETLTELDRHGFDYCFIDTAGDHSEQSRSFMVMADKIIIPAAPERKIYKSQMATVATYEDIVSTLREVDPDAEIPPCGILLTNINLNEKMNKKQKAILELFFEHPLLLPFYLPKRKSFAGLDDGTIMKFEIENMTNKEWLARESLQKDLEEAEDALASIERMA